MFHEVFQMVYQLIHEYRLNKTWQGMGFYATIRWRQGYPMLHGDEKLSIRLSKQPGDEEPTADEIEYFVRQAIAYKVIAFQIPHMVQYASAIQKAAFLYMPIRISQ